MSCEVQADGLERWINTSFDRHKARRVEAAANLAPYGPAALEPLCRLLEDPDLEVRSAAATALGAAGDERAIQPLMKALRQSFWGGSAWANLWLGVLLLIGLLIGIAALLFGVFALKVGATWWIFHIWRIPFGVFRKRREHGRLVDAVTEALVRIAEANPSPELGTVVEDLRGVAADTLQQKPETRELSRRAADRIEALVGDLRSLPVAAAAPHEAPETVLPRPASAPEPEVQVLPRVSG